MKLQLKLAVFILIAAVVTSCSGDDPLYAKSTPTPPWSSCGVALADHNAKIWVEGNYADEACEMIVSYEKASVGLPIWWGWLRPNDIEW